MGESGGKEAEDGVVYWKKLLREAEIDWTDLADVTKDRKE